MGWFGNDKQQNRQPTAGGLTMLDALSSRARAYRDMYRIRRQRHTPLDAQLRQMLRLNIPGATIDPQDTLDRIADVMHGHPDCVSTEIDYGLIAGSVTRCDGFAVAYDHAGNLLARVDVDPDGTLTLIPDEDGAAP